MPTTIKYGACEYLAYTQGELEKLGLVINPHMWLGGGWFHCVKCQLNTHHYAMSHRNKSDCFEVCRVCHTHSRRVDEPIPSEYVKYQHDVLDPRD